MHAPTRAQAAAQSTEEFIEVELDKPIGLKFGRGNDGGAYVTTVDENMGNVDDRIMVRRQVLGQQQGLSGGD